MKKINLKKKCYDCDNDDTWNEKSLTFINYHLNGNNLDNSSKNLQVLCPNCYSVRKKSLYKIFCDIFGNKDLLNEILIFLKITEIGKVKETSIYKIL